MNDSNDSGILSENDLFASLVKSAFEFLTKAIDEFANSAKFSTVHFAIAIELFLKARLMREHWALLVEKTDQADRAAFFRGELKTVTPEQTMQRLKKIAGSPINERSRDIFLKITQHRNKMVHFVHEGEHGIEQSEAAKAQIVAEQCAGWLALRQLLDQWTDFFGDYDDEIYNISHKMERHRTYLEEKFKSKAEEIAVHLKEGRRVSLCPSCQFESVLVSEPMGRVSEADCVVCWYSGAEIEIDCIEDGCNESVRFSSYDGPPDHFPHCKSPITSNFVREALDTGEEITKDNYFEHVEKNCPECGGYHTVVEHHDWYICTQCFETSETIGICDYCSEAQLGGVPEHSSLVGCDFCDGSIGRLRDD